MTSQALYRRYRSQTFDELIGQEHIVQTLRNALAEGRIAHAYLFTGPRGVGKTTVARLLAKAVNCTAEQKRRPCGECESCRAIAEGRAVDVIEMDAASHTSVEDAREIIERVQFRPTSSVYKVYIIDEVHMISTAAFNALLKTLEEPPGHALFVLATTEVHKVPATILSRCQRFTFNRHTVSAITAHLRAIAAEEQVTLEAGTPEAIARAATGSMRDALSILDQLVAYGGGTISLEQVRNLLGATESQEVAALVDALIAGDLSGALHIVAAVAEQGADLRQFSRDLVERLRALMLLKAGGDPDLLDVTEDDMAALELQAAAGDLGPLLAWVKLFSGLDYQLRISPYGQLPLELAIVEAIAAPPGRSRGEGAPRDAAPTRPTVTTSWSRGEGAPQVATQRGRPAIDPGRSPRAEPQAKRRGEQDELRRDKGDRQPATDPDLPLDTLTAPGLSRVEGRPDESDGRPAAPTDVALVDSEPAAPSAVVAHAEATQVPNHPADTSPTESTEDAGDGIANVNADVAALERIESLWIEVLQGIRARDKTLYALLNSGVKPVDVKDNIVVLEVKSDWLLKRLEQPGLRRTVELVLSKQMGSDFGIRCVVEAQHRENPNLLREQIRNSRKDSHVKAAINIFDADIIAVETDQQGD
jgi:DNA polymerase-3 subunit gamma/tau